MTDDEEEEEEEEEYENSIWDIYKSRVDNVSLPEARRYITKSYINDVNYFDQFRRDQIHKNIMATKRKFLDDADEDENLGDNEALRLALAKRQHLINEVTGLESGDDDNDDDEGSEEGDDDI